MISNELTITKKCVGNGGHARASKKCCVILIIIKLVYENKPVLRNPAMRAGGQGFVGPTPAATIGEQLLCPPRIPVDRSQIIIKHKHDAQIPHLDGKERMEIMK